MPLPQESSRRLDKAVEGIMVWVLRLGGWASVLVTFGIVITLITESEPFFSKVPFRRLITDKMWTPLFADPQYGISALLAGTLVTTGVALLVAVPLGTILAIYLSEFAPVRLRELVKPMLELLSAVPTVVYGYFALLTLTPLLQKIYPDLSQFSMLSAGLIMGIMIIPYVTSLGEDSMRSVPMLLREGAFALGDGKLGVALRVVFPGAFSGLAAAYVLAISRAVGETMIVAIAAGLQPKLTFNPLDSAATVTAFIVQVSLGDLPHGSIGYQSIFAAGAVLFLMTLGFNLAGHALRRRFHRAA
ncbi:MAG: phosphate ABC transporter permease subunit PstC [Verrucomicrobia bacterium]|nr:phosphate ABC transporter permease subunit PstC [Verrucomicrobiota bacterium]